MTLGKDLVLGRLKILLHHCLQTPLAYIMDLLQPFLVAIRNVFHVEPSLSVAVVLEPPTPTGHLSHVLFHLADVLLDCECSELILQPSGF